MLVKFLQNDRVGAQRYSAGMRVQLPEHVALELAARGVVELLEKPMVQNVPGFEGPAIKKRRAFIKT
jgi:hypothetical protein